MIKGHVKCSECPDAKVITVCGATTDEVGLMMGSVLVAYHAATPHCSHTIVAWFGDELTPAPLVNPGLAEEHDLNIRCIDSNCSRKAKELATRAPLALVAALTLCFHTSHEGHKIEIKWKDQVWQSPV